MRGRIHWEVRYLPNRDGQRSFHWRVYHRGDWVGSGREATVHSAMRRVKETARRELESYTLSGTVRNIQDLEAL